MKIYAKAYICLYNLTQFLLSIQLLSTSVMWNFYSPNINVVFLFWYPFLWLYEAKIYNERQLPVIVWWTDLLFPHLGNESEIQCSYGKCLSTSKQLYREDDTNVTYIFYGTDFDPENLPLPRKSNHLWALLHEESPMNNYMLSHIPGITLFNLTSTFSRHSDHPLTTQFIPSLSYFIDRKPVSLEKKNKLRKEGLAAVLYLQSHCNVASDRDNYVQNLMKFIEVDSYGICLHNKDLPNHLTSTSTYNDEELFSFIANYKFHIAFENALCDDYITEKLYRALHVGSVPIYMGSATVKDWIPNNNSIIIADDFSSPEELAKFIKRIDRNDTLYNTFLTFKELGVTNSFLEDIILHREWGVNDISKLDFIQSFECNICHKMHLLNNSYHHYTANLKHMNCPQPHPTLGIENIDEMWQQEEWVENYWFAYDKAKAVQMMIQNRDKDTSKFMKYIYKLKYHNL